MRNCQRGSVLDRLPASRLLGCVGALDSHEETGGRVVVIPEEYIASYPTSNAVAVELLAAATVRPRLALELIGYRRSAVLALKISIPNET